MREDDRSPAVKSSEHVDVSNCTTNPCSFFDVYLGYLRLPPCVTSEHDGAILQCKLSCFSAPFEIVSRVCSNCAGSAGVPLARCKL